MSQEIPVPFSSLEVATTIVDKEILIGDGDELYRIGLTDFAAYFQMLNKIAKPISPTEAAPTVIGWYSPKVSSTDPGTSYPNLTPAFDENGNSVASLKSKNGYETLFYFDGTKWTKKEVNIPTQPPTGVVAENNLQSVSGGEVFNKTVLKTGLEITNVENSKNLVNPEYVVNDMIVVTTGVDARGSQYAGGVGIYKMPMAAGTVITISGYTYKSNLFWGYYNDADTVLAHSVLESDGVMTLSAPPGTTCFSMLFKHHSGTYPVPNVMIVEGTEAQPYEPWTPPTGYLGKILGNKLLASTLSNDNIIPDATTDDNAVNLRKMKEYVAEHAGTGGGQAYDQTLNTTDDVQFATVKTGNLLTGSITLTTIIANLPTGSGTPPTGLITGELWIDTTADWAVKTKKPT